MCKNTESNLKSSLTDSPLFQTKEGELLVDNCRKADYETLSCALTDFAYMRDIVGGMNCIGWTSEASDKETNENLVNSFE